MRACWATLCPCKTHNHARNRDMLAALKKRREEINEQIAAFEGEGY